MGPKKEAKKEPQKREKGAENEKKWSIDDPINSETWRCVVTMAVERTYYDCFVLEEFMEKSSNGRRQEVALIDFETCVMKILNDFANGELPYKYTFLLNFSSVFQEAVDYIEKKMDVPVLVLVKIVKVLLFYLREENLMFIKRRATGPPDPIKAMAERPANFDSDVAKKKDVTKKGDNGLKVLPPSVTKEDTKLLKREERAKDDHCIDDAPRNAYFNLYVLLKGFYNPDFPLKLIKANIPLHCVLCIDTSLSGAKRESFSEQNTLQKSCSETRPEEIHNFWEVFLKKIWDPEVSLYFKDTIFQVYVPQRLLCEKKKLAEFIYGEISYLMYDLSDLKRQLNEYLEYIHLWDVEEPKSDFSEFFRAAQIWPENLPEECASVQIVLQCILDAICEDDWKQRQSISSSTEDYNESGSTSLKNFYFSNKYLTPRSCAEGLAWSQELEEKGDFNLLSAYYKIKELDLKYDLGNTNVPSNISEKGFAETDNTQKTDNSESQLCVQNGDGNMLSPGGVFRSYWNKYNKDVQTVYRVDYCLYPLLMTKVLCPYEAKVDSSSNESYHSVEQNSNFGLIENLNNEMRKPHFTVTDGSRSILKAVPYNMKNNSRDFFRPDQFKVVTPEKLKASSAPEFRVTPSMKIQTLYNSEIFPAVSVTKNPFENLKEFVNECLFTNVNDFDILEFLSKPKFLQKEQEYWSSYNCIDRTYSVLNDCIFLRLHNRKDSQNIHHETFNHTLKSLVGLRDFFDYVLEDEKKWLAFQEELYQANAFLSNTLIVRDSFKDFTDADFWMPSSLKFQAVEQTFGCTKKAEEVKTEPSSGEKMHVGKVALLEEMDDFSNFEGYNVSCMAVQFSGLKTIYYANDSSVTVELIERLYGNQDLGIHVNEACHTLHLHSYVCPEPHVLDPFTFHVTYKNGVIVAFSRRLIETFEEIEENIGSVTTVKSKKNSSELFTRVVKKQSKMVKDEDFIYDMAASLPNGLSIKMVRKIVKPCYIKQYFLGNSEEIGNVESKRLFLPNGNVIKMMKDGTVQILKHDSSIITANLGDLMNGKESENYSFEKYEVVTGEGQACFFERGKMKSSKRVQIFQNTDMSTNQIFFRRKDGTDYMLQNDGSFVVQFKDGTKMSSSLLVRDVAKKPVVENAPSSSKENTNGDDHKNDPDEADFVFVFLEITAEHPDYATVIYDSQTEKWRILLPQDSTITIENKGNYCVDLDKETNLKVEADYIRMSSSSSEKERQCTFTADFSVFENKDGGVYCHMEDSSGKIFIVEGNSNCYILDEAEHLKTKNAQEENLTEVEHNESELSEFVASADLQICPSIPTNKNNKLCSENKYFVLKRDVTGAEILHKDDVRKALMKTEKGSLVFTQNLPASENRCFVVVSPAPKSNNKKWRLESILPNPKYEPGASKKIASSTYGTPPTWMHPFPKRKFKFVVPQPLTCRVFVETKRTDLSPCIGTLDCYYCEMSDLSEIKHSKISPEGIDEYLNRLSNDDQDLLTEMYSLAAASLINEKKKLKPTNSEKLEHYLELSRYYVARREYHARCIRYHIIPNYFHHPAGMSWLILNQILLLKWLQSDEKTERQILLKRVTDTDISDSMTVISNEEIEYNLSLKSEQSFSSLSYRSNLSAQTAPTILRTGGICKCKVTAVKDVVSSPAVKCYWKNEEISSESTYDDSQKNKRTCEFQQNEIEKLEKKKHVREIQIMTLQDLMHLGLI